MFWLTPPSSSSILFTYRIVIMQSAALWHLLDNALNCLVGCVIQKRCMISASFELMSRVQKLHITSGQKSAIIFWVFWGFFLVFSQIYHLEFFTDFISFNQAPCSRSKNQYKLGACQKMQNYIFLFKSEYLSIHIYYWTFLYIFSREKTLDLNQRCVWKMVNSTVHHI